MLTKKIVILFAILSLFSISLTATSFTKVASGKPTLVQDGKSKNWCPVCGMSLKKFYKTSYISKLHNHKNRQYCSLRCLVVDMQNHKIDLDSVKVVDSSTEKIIYAKKAFYVVNSDVKGTMSKVSKLAFALEDSAKEFVKLHGGKIVDFKEALKMAKESLALDSYMIKKKKQKKVYPMGKKIYAKMCQKDIDLTNYKEINELKSAIKEKHLCKPLKEKQLQALALYLWEVKRVNILEVLNEKIKVPTDAKCPICGMFPYKYPRWAVKYVDGKKELYFDGVKDMFKYYFKTQNNAKILVTDYYSQKAIDAKVAYYVIGSDVYGPMGDELIPFLNEEDAKTFSIDHRAKKILNFKNITKEEVYKLDE